MPFKGPVCLVAGSKFIEHIKSYVVAGVLIFLSRISQTNHQKFHA
jgi:hypothetical protein